MEELLSLASEYGADVVTFNGVTYLILVERYTPPKQSALFVDSYYPAYQRVRAKKRELLARLQKYAPHEPAALYKNILENDGFFRGKNTLAIHEEYGSLFAVEIIAIDTPNAKERVKRSLVTCGDCRRCLEACPTKALTDKGFNRDICIRQLQDDAFVPNERLAEKMGNKVLGCNECQLACPYNQEQIQKGLSEPTVDERFFDACMAGKKGMLPYDCILGGNYLRPARFLANCLNAFTNTRDFSHCNQALALLSFPDERVVQAAKRYLQRLEGDAWEWEIKYLITEEDYNSCRALGASVRQINRYFATQNKEYARIREREGAFTFTYKYKRADGKGRVELNRTLTEEEAANFVRNGISAEQAKALCGVDLGGLLYIGELITDRIRFTAQDLEIEADRNEYLGVVDYEVECEVKSVDAYERAKAYLTKRFHCVESESKTKRFLKKM